MNHLRQLQENIEQHRFFVELDDRLRPLVDADAIVLTAATVLGRHLGVNRCAYAAIRDEAGVVNVVGNYVDGVPDITGRYVMQDFGAEFVRRMRAGESWIVGNIETDPRVVDVRAGYRTIQARSSISVPLLKDGRFVACMAVHDVAPRAWTESDVALVEGVASRCWESIERSRITRELQASEARFRTITNAMPQIVWTTSADGIVEYWNQRMYEFVGIPEDSHDGAAWAELVHPDDRAAAGAAWAAAVATGNAYEITYRIRHHSGDWRWTLARALPVRDEAGRILKWLGTNTDIDAQKRSEQALQEANRRKDEFLAMLSHELRNPLAPISAAAELLLAGGGDPERTQRAGAIIRRQARHLSSLVDDLLDAARVTQGLVTLDTARLDMHQVVADAAEQVRPLVAERRHMLALQLAAPPICVNGDHKRLVQVLVNLLGNAAKYTPEGGRIEVGMEADGQEVVLSVRDNGIGMSDELVRSAFDLFHQGERTKDRTQGGLGIGLALVKSLVERHGGRVAAASGGPGRGSTITVRLPRVQDEDAVPEAGTEASPAGSRARRILVVDDNVDAAQMVAMLLEVLGHEVVVEYDPLQALASAREHGFDAFILDIGLPGMDGLELARQIRALPGQRGALFIALTGYSQEQDRQASQAAGFHHHFVKPADIDALSRALAQGKPG
jgi:PAS domain S-box-containing protein